MKKSPGKWIKTVLFGKKTSKSTISKNGTADKKPAAVKATVVDLGGDSEPHAQFTDRGTESLELEKCSSGPCVAANSLEPQSDIVSVPSPSDNEMRMQEEAATKAQAAFRGYLARRAFRALKGIIRLQALIRGHLVRRQAAATLRCMQSILKLQALARGLKEAKVDIGANSFYLLATNSFVLKLLVSLPTLAPLSLQYDQADPNSAWNWLERWSLSHFWEPPTKAKKASKPQRKHGNPQTTELDSGKSKRTIRKSSSAITNGDSGSALEADKPKRNLRKIVSQPIETLEENPQNELERVKRNLKKVSASAAAAVSSEKSEIESQHCVKTVPISDVSDKEIVTYSDSDAVVDKSPVLEASSEAFPTDELAEISHIKDPPTVETDYSENGDKSENLNDELSAKEEDSAGKGNVKTRKRRSLPAKPQQQQEYSENISQNTPASLPSYMMATQSAKAKLRAQGKVVEDGVAAEAGYVRRHSLPASSANGKMASLSPRIQKPLQANGKGAIKANNKSLTVSRDGWKR